MCCNIILLIAGIAVLVRGQVLLTRSKEVRGIPARLIGVFFLLPLPLNFLAVVMLGVYETVQGTTAVSQDALKGPALILNVVGIGVCLLVAFVIAVVYAQPVRKRRRDEEDEEVEGRASEHYREHFQAEEEDRPNPQASNSDVTEQPPRPPRGPDDRIRD